MFVDVDKTRDGTNVQWISESGMLDLFVLVGPGPKEVMQQYAVLTGTTSMPQMFAIGYHQCRCEEAPCRAQPSPSAESSRCCLPSAAAALPAARQRSSCAAWRSATPPRSAWCQCPARHCRHPCACRWNYRDEADVKDVDANFDKHAMPYDVLWLDIEHTNGKR
jgi:alpha-glucosidase (family GH31 glycosyl hydrolase)